MLKMVDGTGIIGVDMVCPLGGAVSPPQPPNYDNIEMEGVGSLMLPNSLKAPLERLELIGNSTQGENPAPENPQEIKSTGRKSKNLFDINYFKDKSNLKTLQYEGFTLLGIICNVKPNTNYTLSANITEAQYNLNIANKGTRFSLTSSPTRTLMSNDDGTLYIGFYGATADNVNMDDFMRQYQNIQLEEGIAATDYEPYGYFLDVKVTGKNLFSNKPTDWMIGKGLSWSTYPNDPISIYRVINSAVNVINLKPSTTYSIVNNSEKIVISRMIERNLSENGIKDHDVRSSKYTFVTNQNAMNAILQLKKVDGTELLSSDIESIKIMLVEGEADENVPYEPYTEQAVQIVLNEPLRGIGEYKDVLTKDGVVRKIYPPYEINLNDLRDGGYSKTNTVMFSVKVQNKTVGYASSKPSILCNILPDCALQMSNIYNNDKECIAVGGGIVLFRVNKSRLKDISSFEATKQSFIELMADKKMIVEYALETPVTELLPESVQQKLQALHSENGTTHVFVDSGEVPCGIKLTYRKEI